MYKVPLNLNQGQNQSTLGNLVSSSTTDCNHFEQSIHSSSISQVAQSSNFISSDKAAPLPQIPAVENLLFTEMGQLDEMLNQYDLRNQIYILHALPEVTRQNLARQVIDKIKNRGSRSIQLKTIVSLKDVIILVRNFHYLAAIQNNDICHGDSLVRLLIPLGFNFHDLDDLNESTIKKIEKVFFEYGEDFGRKFISTELVHLFTRKNFQFKLQDNFYALIQNIVICNNFIELATAFELPNIKSLVFDEFLEQLRNAYQTQFKNVKKIKTYKDLQRICTRIQSTRGFYDLLQQESLNKEIRTASVEDPIMEEFSYYFMQKTSLEEQIQSIKSLSSTCLNNICQNIIEKYKIIINSPESFAYLTLEDLILLRRQLIFLDIAALFSLQKTHIVHHLNSLNLTLDEISNLNEEFTNKIQVLSTKLNVDPISCLKLPINYCQTYNSSFNLDTHFHRVFELIVQSPYLKMVCNALDVEAFQINGNKYRKFLKKIETHFPGSTSSLTSFTYQDIRNLCCQLAQQHSLTQSIPQISTSSFTFLGNPQLHSAKHSRTDEEQVSSKRFRVIAPRPPAIPEPPAIPDEEETFINYLRELDVEDIDNIFNEIAHF